MNKTQEYIAVTEAALDTILTSRAIDESGIPLFSDIPGLGSKYINRFLYVCTGTERSSEYFAVVRLDQLREIQGPKDLAYGRIARVLKAVRNPPVHLPRSWVEFHYENLVSFFAEADRNDSKRWVAEIDGGNKCVRFMKLSDSKNRIDLERYERNKLKSPRAEIDNLIVELKQNRPLDSSNHESLVREFDLTTIGGGAVTAGQNFDSWLPKMSAEQRKAVELPPTESLRIVGPAGSGKTLTLCMRAIHISRDATIIGGHKKILVVAHSWAMAERIDQILTILNNGEIPDAITVLPLLSIIQLHANPSSGSNYEVLGDDSQEGSRRVMEILERILVEEDVLRDLQVSKWIREGLKAPIGSVKHGELIFDLYEEISSVIAAQNIFPGDDDKIAEYFAMDREDYLPPFESKQDRIFCMRVFDALLNRLVDRGLVTTDQLILDAIRIFETFAWNVRRQTEGYDYILVDELQLFGPQERLAISLLSRTRIGFTWAAAEDPSQGVFSSLYGREGKSAPLDSIYLNDVHRFNTGLFQFIQFIYSKFPLNVPPLNISRQDSDLSKPILETQVKHTVLPRRVCDRAYELMKILRKEERLAIIVIGDISNQVFDQLTNAQLNPIRLQSFDDIETLSYQKKAVVVSPWQFIGGTQFSHVVLVISEEKTPPSSFARLRELTAIYLGTSRASKHLEIICGHRVPQVLQDAVEGKVIDKIESKEF
ncbi:hypothetical protein YTPLAS21_21390 [Candidatus Nitrosocosmicus sp.]|nr:hypothetical protein YTPLAS21_21390 [Candidatus Nitrosocosmicus sp.]